MSESRECPSHPMYRLYPCKMVVAVCMSGLYSGCVISYEGDQEHGIKEVLDDYAGSLEELFYDGEKLPDDGGIYQFKGDARVCMIGGSDDPITFHGEFSEIHLNSQQH